jgi:type IV pilus assembly protein PilB
MEEAQQTQSLEQMLLEQGRVSTEDLRKVRRLQQERGERLERLLLDLGFISEEDLLAILEREYRLPVVDPASLDIAKDVLALVPQALVIKHHLIPTSLEVAHSSATFR